MNSQEIKKYTIEVLKQGFPNKKTLDKLSTSDSGNLLFDGKEIKGNGSGGSLSDLNIEEIFKANSANEMVSEGETITLPKNYNEYDQIVLGIGTKGDGLDYGLDYFYLYPKTSNKIHFAGYYQRWGSVTFENNICTLNYGQQIGESSNRAFCIASLYGINFGNGQTSDSKDEGVIEKEVQSKIITSTNAKVNQSSFFRNGFEGYKAFNGNSANTSTCEGGWLAASTDTTPWISYTFDEEVKLTKMDIEVCNNSGNITKTFKIQGSNDESTYEDIDEISIAFPPNVLSNYTFNFTPEKNYKSFRIYSNETNYAGAGGYACTFSQIKIYGISFISSNNSIIQYSFDEEQPVGRWYDGRIIYRKMFKSISDTSINDWYNAFLNDFNIDLTISCTIISSYDGQDSLYTGNIESRVKNGYIQTYSSVLCYKVGDTIILDYIKNE